MSRERTKLALRINDPLEPIRRAPDEIWSEGMYAQVKGDQVKVDTPKPKMAKA